MTTPGSGGNSGQGAGSGAHAGQGADGGESADAGAALKGCELGGVHYASGDQVPSPDCNECTCQDGVVPCTLAICNQCTDSGMKYAMGDTFPSRDGCNTCTCTGGGLTSCTELSCACKPEAEYYRHYVSHAPAQCPALDCPKFTAVFSNDCGCGCEQGSSCPPYFTGGPPGGTPEEQAHAQALCPYTAIFE
ncbi:MAG: hypothetical protein ABI548_25975 [Polyangiaceae bacterium]